MNITMEKSDPVYVKVEEICERVAGIIYEHPDLLEDICNLLLFITKASNSITKEAEMFLQNMKCDVLDEDLDAFKLLSDQFISYYELIQDFAFDSDLRVYNSVEYNRYDLTYNTEKIKTFRGVMFEHIVSAFVKPRYGKYLYETGCKIKINGKLVYISYGNGNSRRKMTIDIAGWNSENRCGEFYECKIRPYNFRGENLKYLMHLFSKLEKDSDFFSIGLITADTTANAISKIKELDTNSIEKIVCVGVEKIKLLKLFAFPIGA